MKTALFASSPAMKLRKLDDVPEPTQTVIRRAIQSTLTSGGVTFIDGVGWSWHTYEATYDPDRVVSHEEIAAANRENERLHREYCRIHPEAHYDDYAVDPYDE